MEDTIGAIGSWGCGIIAVLATTWGVLVLVTGRAPERELRRQSASQYGWFCVGIGVALGLIALGGRGGWFGPLTIVGLGLLIWVNLGNYRAQRGVARQRRTTTDQH
ncbi:hypothetical protein AB0283_28280 [Micromonospora vinacea]|uniref:hypothetical protein n=1 Tax=Micromonospora vinacea TaxID=709878 RepID=UPI00344EF5B2